MAEQKLDQATGVFYVGWKGRTLCPECATRIWNDSASPEKVHTGGIHWESSPRLFCSKCGNHITERQDEENA